MRASAQKQAETAKPALTLVSKSDHGDRDALRKSGIPLTEFAPKSLPSDPDYVHPENRLNPDYHAKAVADQKAKQAKMIVSMGYTSQPVVVNPSPAMKQRVNYVF